MGTMLRRSKRRSKSILTIPKNHAVFQVRKYASAGKSGTVQAPNS
jgi:hypothetical protein